MTITHAGLETDLRLATQLDQRLIRLLSDKADILASGALLDLGYVNGTGSDTSTIRYTGVEADAMAAATEVEDVAVTDPTDTSASIAVTRHSLVRAISDLAVGTGFADDLNPEMLASAFVDSYRRRVNALVATAIAGATTNVGTSGQPLTVDDMFDAQFALQLVANPVNPFAGLHNKQLAHFQDALRGEVGPLAWIPATAEMLRVKGPGVAGEWNGITFFQFTDVTTNGANKEGALWTIGAVGYKRMKPPGSVIGGHATRIVNENVMVEFEHITGGGRTKIAGDAYFGCSLLEQARIVGIVTSAT